MSDQWTRRQFLLASAGLVAGAACGGGGRRSAPSPASNAAVAGFPQFDHLVVLMMENRTFDNMLGYLYTPGQVPRGQRFNGVAGKNLSNIDPNTNKPILVSPGTKMNNPDPDPGEEYPHINTDLFGTVIPESNAGKDVTAMQAPFNAPSPIPNPAPMSGFVKDYINKFTAEERQAPTYDQYSIIMNCFAPSSVPVISALAKGFAVADRWHCEVPSQTFCNRSFFHAGTSSGFTSNEPYTQFPFHNTAPTVFNRLDDKGLPWRIYFSREDLIPMTALIHFQPLLPRLGNVKHMEDFYSDVAHGSLPAYSFIEPNMILDHTDEHPPAALFDHLTPPSNVLAGEKLIADVYNAIRTSNSSTGSNWRNTALLITYDEGGGCYDHVSPPSAPTPDVGQQPGEQGFMFDRLGVRVPTVLVSAYTASGTVVNAPMRHTAVARTMAEKWGINYLTQRDKTAPDLAPFFNLTKPRTPSSWPTVSPRPVGDVHEDPRQQLNELQLAYIGAMDAAFPPSGAAANVKTVGDAQAYLSQMATRVPATS